jgi:hypothetical protein
MKTRAIDKVPNQLVCPTICTRNNMLLTYFRVWVFPAGIPEAVEILNSIEGSLEDVLMSVVSSDNNVVVPDSTSSNMVVIEMASFTLPA